MWIPLGDCAFILPAPKMVRRGVVVLVLFGGLYLLGRASLK